MLEGYTAWPSKFAARYRAEGYWEDITLWQMLEHEIANAPDKVALIHGCNRLCYRDLGERIEQLSLRLLEHGLKPRERVVLQLPNGPDFIVTFLALVRIGVIPVLALPAHRHAEISHCIVHSGASAYFAPDHWRGFDYRPMATQMQRLAPLLRAVFINGEAAPGQISLADLMSAPPLSDARERLAAAAPRADDVSHMLLSGGTTGLPKLIPRTHNDYVYNCRQSAAVAGFDSRTVFLAILPMAHNFTLGSPGVLGALACGGMVVIAPDTSADVALPLIARERVTVLSAAMPLVVNWLNSTMPEQTDLSSLKVFMSGGAKLPPELRRRVEQRFGCIYQESFGTGEGLLNMTRLEDPEDIRMISSGSPISIADEIKILDEDGNELPDGEVGELVCRGPYTIRGYYNAPEVNRAAFTADGFYRMGDAVRKIGRTLYVEGRLKDLINRGGEKISSEEVENFLLAHPHIKSACVVAMPDAVYGEKACAFVIPTDGASITLTEVKDFLMARQIAKFKLPERIEVVDEFPISAAGKVLRRELRKIITAKMAAESKGVVSAQSGFDQGPKQ
jgi:2,3-dihydroxybenzoate-AMP ligase